MRSGKWMRVFAGWRDGEHEVRVQWEWRGVDAVAEGSVGFPAVCFSFFIVCSSLTPIRIRVRCCCYAYRSSPHCAVLYPGCGHGVLRGICAHASATVCIMPLCVFYSTCFRGVCTDASQSVDVCMWVLEQMLCNSVCRPLSSSCI